MSVDLDGPEPIYQQIAAILRQGIRNGTYQPRRRLPSEEALREEFGVARGTVRQAVTLLVDEGLAVRVRGKGTYVN